MYYFKIKFIKYIFQKTSRLGKIFKEKMYESENSHFEKSVIAAVFFVCLFTKLLLERHHVE